MLKNNSKTPYLSKSAGLLYLKSLGVNIPTTYFGLENFTPQEERELNQHINKDLTWIVRFDASSEIRFLLKGTKINSENMVEEIKNINQHNKAYKGKFKMMLQCCLNSSVEGVAKLLSDGKILLETEKNDNGHFVRDGNVPYRYLIAPFETEVDHPKLTSRNIEKLHSELIKIGQNYVVEWIVTKQDELFITDAKYVPDSFLKNIENSHKLIIKEGIACGKINHAINMNKTNHILYLSKTSIEYLPFINNYTQGIIFESGGLLSHCVVYQAAKNIPMLIGINADTINEIINQEVCMELNFTKDVQIFSL
ncbi:PEP-utilizing enzyme [Psychrobacillus sp. PGGUH221]|uniref:PEP-utilizing enzyme n=1 Tax=Psychrobacillus sp. PGGUH221 TaxID=3020058 RepID=UPI0035C72606